MELSDIFKEALKAGIKKGLMNTIEQYMSYGYESPQDKDKNIIDVEYKEVEHEQ